MLQNPVIKRELNPNIPTYPRGLKSKNKLPPYIIPNNLKFRADVIKNLLQNGNPEEKEIAIKYLAQADPFYFAKKILKYELMSEEIHRPILERVLNPTYLRTLELLPRGIFKTTVRTITKCLYEIIRNPNVRILIAMNSATNAYKTFSEIKAHITKNPRFIHFFGDLKANSPRWQNSSIIIGTRTLNHKEGTIDSIGKDSSITSQHYDIILCDDIVDENDRDSEAARRDTKYFFEDIQDLLNENGELHITGTRWHFDDVYNYLIEDLNPKLKEQKLNTYHTTVIPVTDDDGKLNFPSMFSDEKISQLMIEKGLVSFSAQYMLQPLAEGTQIFSKDKAGYFDMVEFNPEDGEPYGYCDPALGQNKNACQAPILTAYFMTKGKFKGRILFTHADIAVRPITQTIQNIVHSHIEHHYLSFGIEDNGAQKLILGDVDAYARELTNENIKVIVPLQGVTNTQNKNARIERFEKYFSSQKVLFRKDWQTAPGNYRDLMIQLFQYPAAKYNDAPDAADSLVEAVINRSNVHIGVN